MHRRHGSRPEPATPALEDAAQHFHRGVLTVSSSVPLAPTKSDRNNQCPCQLYLLAIERTFAEQRECWLVQQDEVLTWRLRAEAAEAQLKKRVVPDADLRPTYTDDTEPSGSALLLLADMGNSRQ